MAIIGIKTMTAFLGQKRIIKAVMTKATKRVPMFFTTKSRPPTGGAISFLLKKTTNNQLAKNRRLFSPLPLNPAFLL
jgi:hypothetical protein